LLYYGAKHPDILEKYKAEALQEQIETAYLRLSVEQINDIMERTSCNGKNPEDEALCFELDMGLLEWIEKQNHMQGVAPSFRMVAKAKLETLRLSLPPGAKRLPSMLLETQQKWCQRFRLRCGLSLGAFAARPVLPTNILADKVPEVSKTGGHCLQNRLRLAARWPKLEAVFWTLFWGRLWKNKNSRVQNVAPVSLETTVPRCLHSGNGFAFCYREFLQEGAQ
jgi:hypothetical protein